MKSYYYYTAPEIDIIRLNDSILFKSDTLAVKLEGASVFFWLIKSSHI